MKQYKIGYCTGWHEVWEVVGDNDGTWSLLAVCAKRERAQQIVDALNAVATGNVQERPDWHFDRDGNRVVSADRVVSEWSGLEK